MIKSLSRLLKSIDVAFCKLHAIQFSAPWSQPPRSSC